MAKDPAFLFYSSDFLTGTIFFSNEQVGKFIRLLCIQHQKGHLEEKDMLKICETYDEDLFSKFVKDKSGKYFNERCEYEIIKRKNFSESRSKNRKSKTNISKTYDEHMENENENINYNKERSEFLIFRKSELEQLRNDIFEKLKKYGLTEPIIYSGKKIPIEYYDLVEFVIECINNEEWKLNLKTRFGNTKFELAMKDFINKIKTDMEYLSYENTSDFQRHFSNWLNKNYDKYGK